MKERIRRRILPLSVLSAVLAIAVALFFVFCGLPLRASAKDNHEADTILDANYLRAHNYTLATGDYYLARDLTVSQTIKLATGASVSLCLNGYTLQYSNSGTASHEPLISVVAANFTLNDCDSYTSDGTLLYRGALNGNRRVGSVVYAHGGYVDPETGALVAEDADELPVQSDPNDYTYIPAEFTLNGGNITGGRGTLVYDPYENFAQADADLGYASGRYGYGYGEEGFYLAGGGVYLRDADFVMNGGAIYGNATIETEVEYTGDIITRYYRAGEGQIYQLTGKIP